MRRIGTFAAVLVAAAVTVPSVAPASTPHSFRDEVFALAMGGAYTAGGWRGSGLFYNPATVALKGFSFNVPIRFELGGVGGVSQLTDVVKFFKDNKDQLKNINQLSTVQAQALDAQAQKLDGKGGTIRVLPAIRLGWQGFAIQTYGVLQGTPTMDTGIFQPRMDVNAISDVGVIAGYGRRMSVLLDRWYLGASVKYFDRWQSSKSLSLDQAQNPSLSDIIDLNSRKTGFGVDVGALIPYGRQWTFGVDAQDLITAGGVRPPTALNLGVRYMVFPRLNLVGDYRDVFNSGGGTLPMHLYMGGELDLTLLRLRGGFYQGYPTAGIGINLWLAKLDVTYYSKELGPKLGYQPEDNIAVELEIGLD